MVEFWLPWGQMIPRLKLPSVDRVKKNPHPLDWMTAAISGQTYARYANDQDKDEYIFLIAMLDMPMSREELTEILCDYIMSIEDVGTLEYDPNLISWI